MDDEIEKDIDEDIQGIYKIADQIFVPNRVGPLNRLSRLPRSKEHIKLSLKKRLRYLASLYISLSSFTEDEDVDHMMEFPKSERSKMLLHRMIDRMDEYTAEMREFKLIEIESEEPGSEKEGIGF